MPIKIRNGGLLCALIMMGLANSGCFTTFQTARVKQGFHFTASSAILSDQMRDGKTRGHDVIATLTPSLGHIENNKGIEFGVSLGGYLEEGFNSSNSGSPQNFGQNIKEPLIVPYLKVGFNQNGRNKFAIVGQSAFILPSSLVFIYSYDYTRWTPYVSMKRMFSDGTAGDDPIVTRFQQKDQNIWVFGVGTEWQMPLNPGIEFGILRNTYNEALQLTPFSTTTKRQVL
ncbi:MAG: hypothetical protein VX603_07185 [Gemmatimonadota bacterium]|nr:hypothetical protein [Gemmatimonadota bacterium]